ncbi:MAG: hypothetical protein PUB22_10625 [Clostridiales bacterium]|nr:hypothetical protein [Clostridiales bacterium]
MNIVYDEALKDYMTKKNIPAIVVESYMCQSCAGLTEISSRFADAKTAARIKENGCRVIPGEVGEILILTRGLTYDETITFKLQNFLGIKGVAVKGIRP